MAWTQAATDKLVEMYRDGTVVEDLMIEFGRNKTSIINKLVKEGVYEKPKKLAVRTKKMMIREIQLETGLDLPTLEKVDKKELTLLTDWLIHHLQD